MSHSKDLLELQQQKKNEEYDEEYQENLFQEMCGWLERMNSDYRYVHYDDYGRAFIIANEFGEFTKYKVYLPEKYQDIA